VNTSEVGKAPQSGSDYAPSITTTDEQVVTIANRVAGSGVPAAERPRLVLIAGPTSSGKTTFALRLCVALETLGAKPTVVSVDSYYKSWKDIDARGPQFVDWESLAALNLDLLNDHLLKLLAGEEVGGGEMLG